MMRYLVEVKEIPVRNNRQTYKKGETFEISENDLKGIESFVEIIEKIQPESQSPLDNPDDEAGAKTSGDQKEPAKDEKVEQPEESKKPTKGKVAKEG